MNSYGTVHPFRGRSFSVIDDFSVEERRYLFQLTKELILAIEEGRDEILERFRVHARDFCIYDIFMEHSTRTRESFRNAARFLDLPLYSLNMDSSSLQKGESLSDTVGTLTGYGCRVFIVRSKIEGLCKWLEEYGRAYAERNKSIPPSFVNAGDGRHEHPTQELLDEFAFLQNNDWSSDALHISLVGDLYHGRTIHSKVDGLKIFREVRVDLVAPSECALPASYYERMKENGFTVRSFSSIEEYLQNGDLAPHWYFSRLQLERMGEKILKNRQQLLHAVSFYPEYLDRMPEQTRFYHPFPRNKDTPLIPPSLDHTSLNAWEAQSANGMWIRVVLLALLSGHLGGDFARKVPTEVEDSKNSFIEELPVTRSKNQRVYSEGVIPIQNGLVIDHICRGESPEDIRQHMMRIVKALSLSGRGGEWVSSSSEKSCFKGLIFRPDHRELRFQELKRLAAIAPSCTLNYISQATVMKKYKLHMPPSIYHFDDISCSNDACITNRRSGEAAPQHFVHAGAQSFRCLYCAYLHSFKEIWNNA